MKIIYDEFTDSVSSVYDYYDEANLVRESRLPDSTHPHNMECGDDEPLFNNDVLSLANYVCRTYAIVYNLEDGAFFREILKRACYRDYIEEYSQHLCCKQ